MPEKFDFSKTKEGQKESASGGENFSHPNIPNLRWRYADYASIPTKKAGI
jgi:hypothetical protein